MPPLGRRRAAPRILACWCGVLLLALGAVRSAAAPSQFVSVGDPIERELRVLDLFPDSAEGGRVRLPHFFSRPFELRELEGASDPPPAPWPVVARSLARIERVLGRDARDGFRPDLAHRATPRLLSRHADDQRFEISAGIEGSGETDRDTSRFLPASGLHLRGGFAVDRWLLFSHLVIGQFDRSRRFADPLIANTDITTLTEEGYVGYSGDSWGASLGRNRWHWGPGDEGSLILSKTSAPLTGLAFRGRIAALDLDAVALDATLDRARGEQLAAHRLEWRPRGRLRLGLTEAARYHASGWSPLYAAGVIPYILVQRLEAQDQPESSSVLRNNVLLGIDAAFRPADGTRLYGELVIDDLHSRTARIPDKLAWQLGWEGAGMIGPQRLTWGGELTRVWRYVYTSFFGQSFEAQGRPIGFPTGPDSRRLTARVGWDPSVDWQLTARGMVTDRGEGTLDQPFVPGSPREDPSSLSGVVEHTREAEIGARWWPAGGILFELTAGYRWTENRAHVAGAGREGAYQRFELRLTR